MIRIAAHRTRTFEVDIREFRPPEASWKTSKLRVQWSTRIVSDTVRARLHLTFQLHWQAEPRTSYIGIGWPSISTSIKHTANHPTYRNLDQKLQIRLIIKCRPWQIPSQSISFRALSITLSVILPNPTCRRALFCISLIHKDSHSRRLRQRRGFSLPTGPRNSYGNTENDGYRPSLRYLVPIWNLSSVIVVSR